MTRTRTLASGGLRMALAMIAALPACTSADDVLDTTTQAGDLPGTGLSRSMYPLMNPSLTPLAPVNSVTKAIFTQACISKPDGSGPDPGDFFKQAGGGTTYVKFAKSRSAVDDALAVKVSAAFAGPTAGLSAEVEASVETSTRAESVYLLGELFAYTHQVLAATCPLVLTENATTLLLDDDAFGDVPEADRARYRAAAFMRTCGDGFVQTRLLGAGGTLIMEWRSKSAEDKAKIRAELEASFGKPVIGGKIGVAAALSRNKLAASATLTTTLVAQGAIPGMPAPGDIDTDPSKLNDIVSKIDELKQKLAENGSDVTNLVPMAARLSAYDGVPPWKGWNNYDAAQKAKIRASLALIKTIADEMEAFLALRANLVKELDYDLAQIDAITTTYPLWFNYSLDQRNYAGTAVLPRHGTTPAYPDLASYKTSFRALKTKLQTEMDACKDDGAHGFMKCKPSATLPGVVAKEIRKWRDNRPRKLDLFKEGPTDTSEHANFWCGRTGDGVLVSTIEARFARAWSIAFLPADARPAWAGHHVHYVSDALNGEKCDNGVVAHSRVWDPDVEKRFLICGTQPMWQLAALCRNKTSLWDDGYWKDELDLTGL